MWLWVLLASAFALIYSSLVALGIISWEPWSGFATNLVPEILGIIATVVIIDALNKRREERQWLPARGRAYARILEIIDDLFVSILPCGSFIGVVKIYMYEDNSIYTYVQPLGFDEAVKAIDKDKKFYEINGDRTDIYSSYLDGLRSKIGEAYTRLQDVIKMPILKLDSEFIELTFAFDEKLRDLERYLDDLHLKHAHSMTTLLDKSLILIDATINLREWLVKEADQPLSHDQFMARILAQSQSWRNAHPSEDQKRKRKRGYTAAFITLGGIIFTGAGIHNLYELMFAEIPKSTLNYKVLLTIYPLILGFWMIVWFLTDGIYWVRRNSAKHSARQQNSPKP